MALEYRFQKWSMVLKTEMELFLEKNTNMNIKCQWEH